MQKHQVSIKEQSPSWWQFDESSWLSIKDFFNCEEIEKQQAWQRLKPGLSNISFRLRLQGHYYFIQLPCQQYNRLRPFKGNYPALDRFLAKSDLKPWLTIHHLDRTEVCISEWIDNDPQSIRFSNTALAEQLIEFLVRLHQKELLENAPQASPINILEHLVYYHAEAIKANPEQSLAIDLLLEEGLFFAKNFQPTCYCHSDLHPYNLLWDANNQQLKVIDWEYACVSDPLLDLAGLLVNWQLSHAQKTQLIEAYQEKRGLMVDPQKLKDMGCLSSILSKLWHFAARN